ncbi:MAG: pyruvate, phosphate dikinase [Candidatus Thermoplasmatota archaeon]|nr:pyruvate, phosphate dikinase [Candidatus Thermoplasmatota archaeon]
MVEMKWVYTFEEGGRDMKELLGGKGANLCEMSRLGIPVPPGFIISTEACRTFFQNGGRFPSGLEEEVIEAVKRLEKIKGSNFGDPKNPLLISVRSGARSSMPGMMDTILNLGMNPEIVEGLIERTGNERFVRDSYRRFVQMYGDVVMGLKPSSKDDVDPFEEIMEKYKERNGINSDVDLAPEDLSEITRIFHEIIKERIEEEFPNDPMEQLWGAIKAVFSSWTNERARKYRIMNNIPEEWGTAVNIQCMVFGNMGYDCATGVAFTRDPSTGEDVFFGEYLINAQGEDVVAGIRTPHQVTKERSRKMAIVNGMDERKRLEEAPSLEESMPDIFLELVDIYKKLEGHYKDMQDIEFTVERGKLWILQTRNGKRTAEAAVKIAVDMVKEGMIDERTAIMRITPEQIDRLLHPTFDPEARKELLARGLPASPGAATGVVVFNAEDAEYRANEGDKVILVRIETSPEDIGGMQSSEGILTTRGGMTSHAAVVARGMGKCCVSGCGKISVDYSNRSFSIGGRTVKEGDWISLDGTTGEVFLGKIVTIPPKISGNFSRILEWGDEFRKLDIRTNADTPNDSKVGRNFGAKGIGLCRTEHMFFEGERIKVMREMILAEDINGRRAALDKLLPMQREDFHEIFSVMSPYPVTIRLLDPPLHEFLPHDDGAQNELADILNIHVSKIKERVDSLREFNPMLGHRGCRLAITYPEITRMQARAIIEAACDVKKKGLEVRPEIMVPFIGTERELELQREIIIKVASEVMSERGIQISYTIGTMIEIPRAALVAGKIAEVSDFFSFGTNDLTQMTYGYSRDDSGTFLEEYISKGVLEQDPFKSIDIEGVGELLRIGVERGRSVCPNLKIGICGEHGGDPKSIRFFHISGLNYVSCSPFRVPVARLAAAQAAIEDVK